MTDPLADPVDRGLRYAHGILAVLEGSKVLRMAVGKVFGTKALQQRCSLHKRRNMVGYLPEPRRKRSSGSPGSSRTPTRPLVCVTLPVPPPS